MRLAPFLKRAALCCVAACTGIVASGHAPAAAQGTDASIDVSVRDTDGKSVPDAIVMLSNASNGFRATARTSAAGRCTFSQLPLGPAYRLTATRSGYTSPERAGLELRLGSRLRVNFKVATTAIELTPLIVDAGRNTVMEQRRLGGSTRVDRRDLEALPVAGRNFTDLAALSPFVGADLSIAGQRATSTDIRLDGLQARNMLRGGELGRGPYTVSLEAVRAFEVITNVYDVRQSRNGGGVISAITRSGTNDRTTSAFAYHKSDALSAANDYLGRGRDLRRFSVWQWGGSAGGAIVHDRLFYFAALDRQDSDQPLNIADLRTPQDEIEVQVARDSLARFLNILQRNYGISGPQVGIFRRRPVANTFFARLDWQASAKHRVTLRNNFSNWSDPYSGVGDQLVSLFESRSSIQSHDNQLLLSLRSSGGKVANELSLGFSAAHRELIPNTLIPRSFVRVRSQLPDGTLGDVRLQFGGNRLAPERSGERQLQLLNTTSLQIGDHLLMAGTDNSLTRLQTFIPTDEGGLFEFDDLAHLESGSASRYSRQVPITGVQPNASQYVLDAGLFAQDEWRLENATLTVGARWDVTSFATRADRNLLIEQSFGLRNDNSPTDWRNLQPRAQLVIDVGGRGTDELRFGGGAFAVQPHYYLHANDVFFSGNYLADLTLTGARVPAPDYARFRTDLSSVPGVPTGIAAPAYINLISPAYRTPTAWKANAAYQHRFGNRLVVGANVSASRTVHNYQYFDRNLRDDPAFRLHAESDRAVFVPAATIPSTGRTAAQNAFKDARFTHVLELVSTGEVTQRAVVLNAAIELPRAARISASYTYNKTLDNSSFSCCIARTASLLTPVRSDPRDLSGSRGPADTDFRNKLVAYGELPEVHGFQISARYVGSTGRPYSLVVNGDINGDDYNGNDLAFIFDPDDPTTPPDIAASMRRLLANPASIARDYIRNNLGRIAPRNGGYAPWVQRLDVRARMNVFVGRRRAEISVDVLNFANLLNSSWGGQYLLPQGISASNPTTQQLPLLNVVGFDQTTQRYRYTVNENVGVLRKRGDPYQIQLGLHVTVD